MDNDEEMIQKIIEMLTRMEADRKSFQEKMAADRKADEEERKAFTEWMKAKTEATRAETKAILAETKARREKTMLACFGQPEARLEYEEPASGNIKDTRCKTSEVTRVLCTLLI
jgi:hypothetical protein